MEGAFDGKSKYVHFTITFPLITLERLYPHYNNIEIELLSGSKVVLSKQTGVR